MNQKPEYEINMELGECYLFSGDFSQSEEHYLRAANHAENQPEPYMGLATIAVQRGELDAALEYYSKAIARGEGDKAFAGIGLVKMERGQHEEAIDCFMAAARRNPKNTVAVNCLLREAARIKKLESLVEILWNCLAANPAKDEIRTSVAECLMTLGRTDEARSVLDALLRENPTHTAARALHRIIDAA